jgi:hypothetical protein
MSSSTQTMIDFDCPTAPPVVPSRRPSLEIRFLKFVTDNPSIPRTIIRLARERKAAGQKWWGMRAAFELLRGQPELIVGHDVLPGGQRVKLNNDYTAPMARLVMKMAPDLDGFFNTR